MIESSSAIHRAIAATAAAAVLLSMACASAAVRRDGDIVRERSESRGRKSTERKVVRSGDLAVAVESPEQASAAIVHIVEEAGGFVELSTVAKDSTVRLRCRVPASKLDQIVNAVAALGEVKRRTLSAADVTERYSDLETRLRNDLALRERLRELLSRAANVQDVLAIEKELNRIQSEIETLQARFDRLKSELELSALSVDLERTRLLGPLGYVGYGLWWALSKLFIVR